jgi:hypothetical protein
MFSVSTFTLAALYSFTNDEVMPPAVDSYTMANWPLVGVRAIQGLVSFAAVAVIVKLGASTFAALMRRARMSRLPPEGPDSQAKMLAPA